ncbi:MAG: hypothetical protein HQL32_09505 [Planctomycetes bacterium]|nr:hypothetical protein [Planctomycetota bacterium]
MFELLIDADQYRGIANAKASANNAHSKASKAESEVHFLQWKVERLTMVTEALWEIIKKSHKITDQDLQKYINQVDLKDGKLDGKVAKTPPVKCSRCKKTVQRGKTVCMYCGEQNQISPFKR